MMTSTCHGGNVYQVSWKELSPLLSQRIVTLLKNLELVHDGIADFTNFDGHSFLKYRGVGKKSLTELRMALARFGATLPGLPVWQQTIPSTEPSLEELRERYQELLVEISSVKRRITEAIHAKRETQQVLRKKVIPQDLRIEVYESWKKCRSYSEVARKYGLKDYHVEKLVARINKHLKP